MAKRERWILVEGEKGLGRIGNEERERQRWPPALSPMRRMLCGQKWRVRVR